MESVEVWDEILAVAKNARPKCRTWMDLHNAVYGVGAICGQKLVTQRARALFVESEQHKQIQQMIEELRAETGDVAETSGRLLVRLPKSLHAALLAEADQEGVSVNQLCIAKLSAQLAAIVNPIAQSRPS